MRIIFLVLILLVSGCLSAPEPTFNLNDSVKLDFNPLSFEAVKLWNSTNFTNREVQLDACNTAKRIDSYTWQITVKYC